MQKFLTPAVACLTLFIAAQKAEAVEPNAELKALAAAATKEGVLSLSWSQSTLAGSQGAAMMETSMNKLFGSNVRIRFAPGPEMARIGNQLATEFQAKQPASTDIYLGSAAQIAPLVKFNMFEQADWTKYLPGRIKPEFVEVDNQFMRFNTALSGVTYNASLAPFKPTTLDDFLKPAWKGKIASTPYAASFDVFLADDVWGRQRTVDYVKKLSSQIAGLMRCGDAERIATGEFLALVMDCTGQDALIWQARGAPVEQMVPLDAAQERYYYLAVPKNAKSPNAAKLFITFMMTEEGQKIAYDTWKTDLHLLPGSQIAKTVDKYSAQNVKFKEVTIEWWLKHPEIDEGKSELIKILTTR
ncbi:ABC transporter substrate-binding protein [Roseiarcaceae bacterium H3SJ34-1]|uniref:ABC transporter substrate-binding protein n=1 Tax=Terripilifer ovatus TaxID=3032367 RepID=UPI003AB94F96|nr:ABC transporter substrate-binding protein [Roseiarcaceae bacterium H3SJ34-1]